MTSKPMKNKGYSFLARHVLERHWLVATKAMYPNLNAQKEYAMKQYAQQVRTQLLTLIMAGVAAAGVAMTATAAGLGGGIHADVGAGASAPAPEPAQAGGAADAHMSPSGSANNNAQWQSGATRGADRAAERMNAEGADLEATGTATVKGKRKH
jgi:hypothetical protein